MKDNGAVTTSGQTTVPVTGVVIPANTHVECIVACANAAVAVGQPTGVSDGTNSYVMDDSSLRSTTVYESIWKYYDAAGGTKTITVTLAASCNYTEVAIIGTSGMATTLDLDETSGGDQGGTTTVTIISVGNVDAADEISLIGMMWGTGTALTKWPPTNYTSLLNAANATRSKGHAIAYRTPLTAGSPETGSNEVILGGATDWAGILATYKGYVAPADNTGKPGTAGMYDVELIERGWY